MAAAVHLDAVTPFDHRPVLADFFGGVGAPAPLRPIPAMVWKEWAGGLLAGRLLLG